MKHSEIKTHIIKTASDLFYNNGYNLTGINEIISEAGIAKATLYNHFKSKEDICISYLNYKNDAFLRLIKDFISSKENGIPRIIAILEFLQLFYNDSKFNGCWCINTISELPKENVKVRSEIQKQKKDFLEFIEEIISKNLPNKTKEETASLSKQIYLLYESAVAESYLHQNDWPIKSAIHLCKKIID
ncbi:TetR/AcrR family transcriptional regulator [Polaribacter batillariae]|uniref:TetR/AcrR family transcriptional regulator n=1 Tax=Polaribacter batillariae TaxID=2808900 RepID=A0ABX7SW46_9FLAO|nr:TetR/AcrR family transcriptional regulator [Polaribacter batillariae]QTD38411.1 TetR/AcrR family transcriptional regulator [Polaribacter batillariae]